jgi:hypothetical protein
MARKTVSFDKSGIGKLPDDKPVLYRVQSESGKTNYEGVAETWSSGYKELIAESRATP